MDEFDELEKLFSESDNLDFEQDALLLKYEDLTREFERMEEVSRNYKDYIEKYDKEFKERTKLTAIDDAFLVVAIGLQVLRMAIFLKPRVNDAEAAKKPHEQNEKVNDKLFGKHDPTDSKKMYYASFGDILDVNRPVPYDITNGTKLFELGGKGKGLGSDHRFKVPGHDPVIGLVYGTANIVTNTITTWSQKSAHVKYMIKPTKNGEMYAPECYAKAQTLKIFEYLGKRMKDEPKAVCAALIKQIYHIKGDEYSKMGIPIPIVGAISTELAEELAKYGIDWVNLKQSGYAWIIDYAIAIFHRLIYDGPNTEMDLNLYKVRTKKILHYSGIIAESSNVLYVGVNCILGNEGAIGQLDLGGIVYLIGKLIHDHKFMADIKREFMDNELDKLIEGEVNG